VKPTDEDSWVADALVGKWALFPSLGTGQNPVLRPIIANTETAFSIAALAGMEAGVEFQLVTLESNLSGAAQFSDSSVKIELVGFKLNSEDVASLVAASECRNVTLRGCSLEFNSDSPSVSISDCNRVNLEHCKFSAAADGLISMCGHVRIIGCYNNAGGALTVEDCDKVVVEEFVAFEAASIPLRLVRNRYCSLEMQCDDGDDSGLYLEDNGRVDMSGNLLTGTGNAQYGVEVEGGGRITWTGCDMDGDQGDILFLGNEVTWENATSETYGVLREHAGNAVGNASYGKALDYGAAYHMAEVGFAARLYEDGYHNFAYEAELVAAGTTVDDALELGAKMTSIVATTASGTGVKIPAGAALPGVLRAIANDGAQTLKVYATGGTIDGGASIDVATGKVVLLMSTGALSWRLIAVSP
jgi:hypothetical protein